MSKKRKIICLDIKHYILIILYKVSEKRETINYSFLVHILRRYVLVVLYTLIIQCTMYYIISITNAAPHIPWFIQHNIIYLRHNLTQ